MRCTAWDDVLLGVCATENGATIAGEIGCWKDLMSTTFRRYAPDLRISLKWITDSGDVDHGFR